MVSEADARCVPGAQNAFCLICETESAIRRIWHYPADWHRLDDEKLMALFDAPFNGSRREQGLPRGDAAGGSADLGEPAVQR